MSWLPLKNTGVRTLRWKTALALLGLAATRALAAFSLDQTPGEFRCRNDDAVLVLANHRPSTT